MGRAFLIKTNFKDVKKGTVYTDTVLDIEGGNAVTKFRFDLKNLLIKQLSRSKTKNALAGSDADIFQGCGGGWISRFNFMNFFQGQYDLDDGE